MFERFTDRARRAIAAAHDEASTLGHNFLGTEHLLLGMLRDETSVAARVLAARGLTYEAARAAVVGAVDTGVRDAEALAAIGIDLDAVTTAIDTAFGDGTFADLRLNRLVSGKVRIAPRAKKAMELALREALALGHNYIGTEHLLLAIVRLREGVAYQVLDETVAPVSELRDIVLAELEHHRRGA